MESHRTERDPLADEREIRSLVLRYCRAVDRMNLDELRTVYHPGGVDHHTGFNGSVDEYIEWVRGALSRFTGTMHILGNQIIELVGDEAVVETYGQAVHWGEPTDDPRVNFTSGFRYVDHVTFANGRWGITERWAVREWTRSDAGRQLAKEGVGPAGTRDGSDPLMVLRSRIL